MKYTVLVAAMLLSTVGANAQEKMQVHLKSSQLVEYDVNQVEKVTFTEGQPVTPPTPSQKVMVKSVDDVTFTYDAQGRCTGYTEQEDGYGIGWTFDYATMSIGIMGMPLGQFEINEAGYLTRLYFNLMGAVSEATMEYDADGYLIHEVVKNSSPDGSYQNAEATLTWENGLLTKSHTVGDEYEADEDECIKQIDDNVYFYSDRENVLGQWTYAMTDMEDNPLVLTGMFGKAPAKFPSGAKMTGNWDGEEYHKVSYTFNADGTVATETMDGTTYTYTYYSSSNLPAKALRMLALPFGKKALKKKN